MKIKDQSQLNQGVDQYKLLSSTSGVGSLIATRMGTFIMPLSIDNWHFVSKANNFIKTREKRNVETTKNDVEDLAIAVIEDPRFVKYLQAKEGLPNLQYLVSLPHMQLDDYNKLKVEDNNLFKKYFKPLKEKPQNHQDDFVIPAVIFPRWLYSEKTNKLKPLSEWKKEWLTSTQQRNLFHFAPPRDPDFKITHKKRDGSTFDEYGILKQMPLVLICKKGHISDIPWELFFRASLDSSVNVYKEGFDFNYYDSHSRGCPACKGEPHQLTYTESQNKASGWGMLKCTQCGEVVSLDGIMNLRPKCLREMPWQGIDKDVILLDSNSCKKEGTNEDSIMQVALLTSSGVYYADKVSSLYIKPSQQGKVLSNNQNNLLTWIEKTIYYNYIQQEPTSSRDSFWTQTKNQIKQLAKYSLPFPVSQEDIDIVGEVFLGQSNSSSSIDEEQYRYEEFEVFSKNSCLDIPQLQFNETIIPSEFDVLRTFFKKITQVHSLCVTQTQMSFFRGTIPNVQLIDGSIVYPSGMKLFKGKEDEIYTYPATQSFGEGLFFEFNEERINQFSNIIAKIEPNRYSRRDRKMCSQLSAQLDKYKHEERFYLIHTFAHIIIKELEFSCGYPSASLAERIYYSDRMNGVLIYTTDGAEGSMGGLVWQGRPDLMYRTIMNAIERAKACSSDPICWEHDEETMNYASCFSCSMISETSCEYRNFGLDRKAIIDDNFGYFSNALFDEN